MIPSNYMKIQMNLGRGVDGDEEGRQRRLDEVEEARGLDDDEVRGGAGAAGLPGTVAMRSGRRRGGGREDDLAEPGRRGQASGRGGRRGRGAGTRGTGAAQARKDEDDGTRGRGSGRGGGEDEPRAAAALHVDLKK